MAISNSAFTSASPKDSSFSSVASAHPPASFFRAAIVSLLVILITGFSLVPFLSQPDVFQVSEGREGVVVNSILEHEEYILPLRNGELIPSKPPLLHWLNAALAKHRGSFENFELRFVSSMAAALLAALMSAVIARCISIRVSLLSAAILLSTYGFRTMGADGRVDMLLCLLFCAAVFSWYSPYHRIREAGKNVFDLPPTAYRLPAIFSGLAILTKGPLGIVLPLIVIASFLVAEEGWRSLRALFQKSWIWAVCIPLPWYIAAVFQGGRAFLTRFFFENAGRFYGGDGITLKPPTFYLTEFWGHALPWSVVFGAAVIYRLWQKVKYSVAFIPSYGDASRARVGRFSVVWIISLLVFYSLSAGKRSSYLLTILPPFSILLALWFDAAWTNWQEKIGEGTSPGASASKVRRIGMWGFFALFLGGLIPVLFVSTPLASAFHAPKAEIVIQALREAMGRTPRRYAFSFASLSIAGALFWLRGFSRGSLTQAAAGVFLGLQAVMVVLVSVGLSTRGITHGYKAFADEVAAAVPDGQHLTFVKKKLDESFDGFFFYFGRTIYLFEPGKQLDDSALPQEPGWYLARNSWINQQPDRWTKRIEKVLTGGRRVDNTDQQVSLFRLRPAEVAVVSENPGLSEIPAPSDNAPPSEIAVESTPPLLSPSVSEDPVEDR